VRTLVVAASLLTGCAPSASTGSGLDASSADAPLDAPGLDAGNDGTPCLLCSDASFDAPLSVLVQIRIDQICANVDGCHGQGAGGMSLVAGAEFDAMVGVPSTENPPMKRVAPGDPQNSYVFVKLACDGGIPAGTACMPLSAGFDPQLVKLFHDWIEAGAPTQ
jgi:hypothetical protein